METTLCLSIRFIQPFPLFHGSRDAGEPEWPPSPLRAFQSLLNAACGRTRGRPLPPEIRAALHVLELLRPQVVAPVATLSTIGHRAYVPHNQADLVTAAWHRGNTDASIAEHRVEKDHRPLRIHTLGDELPTVHYLYDLALTTAQPQSVLEAIRPSVRSIHCLGWGIDQVVADARLISPEQSVLLVGERYLPSPRGGQPLRTPKQGSLDALQARHDRFLNRLTGNNFTPVPPLTALDVVRYRRESDPLSRPHAVFRLVDDNDDTVTYPQSRLIHIAGMVRHLAIGRMERNPPGDLRGLTPERWIEQYVAGHRDKTASVEFLHSQLSYIPLQSIGTDHTDPGVRRVMIVGPAGDDQWLTHIARQLDGVELQPDPKFPSHQLPPGTRLELTPDNKPDGVRDAYTRPSTTWASVTPVILPGHDDHKPEKALKLIQKALAQSGVDQPCTFEWSPFSHFRKMLSAHKYIRDESAEGGKRKLGYIRPDHLLDQSAVHVKVTFDHPVPGPIAVGAGRHCGFGLMAAVQR